MRRGAEWVLMTYADMLGKETDPLAPRPYHPPEKPRHNDPEAAARIRAERDRRRAENYRKRRGKGA